MTPEVLAEKGYAFPVRLASRAARAFAAGVTTPDEVDTVFASKSANYRRDLRNAVRRALEAEEMERAGPATWSAGGAT